jgi:hypothetical protein
MKIKCIDVSNVIKFPGLATSGANTTVVENGSKLQRPKY